jgi:hypothetical protein
MKTMSCCLLGILVAASGCVNMNNTRTSQRKAATPATAAKAVQPPPVTQDQVTEANATAKARALGDEIARDAGGIQQASFTTGACSH